MAKTRAEKESQLQELNQNLEQMKSAVIVDYKGLKVKETEELRKNLLQRAVSFHIVKASLVKIALKNSGIAVEEAIFDKPVAMAFAREDEVAPAKEINAYTNDHEALEILGGILERRFISTDEVKRLAALPGREELYAKLVGSIASPLSGLVNVLVGNTRGLVNVLNAYKGSK